jgi:hypothetical protein
VTCGIVRALVSGERLFVQHGSYILKSMTAPARAILKAKMKAQQQILSTPFGSPAAQAAAAVLARLRTILQ